MSPMWTKHPALPVGPPVSVAENAATSTVVYTATATDPETGTVTYSLSGTDASAFSIGSSTGVVTLNASADLRNQIQLQPLRHCL